MTALASGGRPLHSPEVEEVGQLVTNEVPSTSPIDNSIIYASPTFRSIKPYPPTPLTGRRRVIGLAARIIMHVASRLGYRARGPYITRPRTGGGG